MSYKQTVKEILSNLGFKDATLLGQGEQSSVFICNHQQIVRIYKKETQQYIDSLIDLYKTLGRLKFSYELPVIYSSGSLDNIYYTVEKRLQGTTLGKLFPNLSNSEKKIAVDQYFAAIKEIGRFEFTNLPFGQLLKTGEEITDLTWSGYLTRKIRQRIEKTESFLEKDISNFAKKLDCLLTVVNKKPKYETKRLVHGDYFYNNVLFDKNLKLSAILDFSNSTVIGDPRMDLSCGLIFFDLDKKFEEYLYEQAVMSYGQKVLKVIKIYQLYYGIYLSDSYFYHPKLYEWCVRTLNNRGLWNDFGLGIS